MRCRRGGGRRRRGVAKAAGKAVRKAARKAAGKAGTPRRPGPGEYLPDPTEGVTRPEDLPAPIAVRMSRDYAKRRCPLLRAQGLPRRQEDPQAPRPRRHDDGAPARSSAVHGGADLTPARDTPDVLGALLLEVRRVLLRRHLRHRAGRRAIYREGDRDGGQARRGGRSAVPDGLVAHVARPPGLRPVRHDSELGRGVGRDKSGEHPTLEGRVVTPAAYGGHSAHAMRRASSPSLTAHLVTCGNSRAG